MDAVTFKLAALEDAATVGRLIEAMDVHYHGAGNTQGAARATEMVEAVLRSGEGARFLIAYADGRPAGLAAFALLRPGHRLQAVLFVKDLYTLPELRGRGIGRAMMGELARFARSNGVGRIDLTTDAANAGARRLYEGLGGAPQQKVMYRFDGAGLARLADEA